MPDTITLWIMEHDDPAVTFVINTREDMETNFADLIDEVNETVAMTWPGDDVPVSYDASRVLRMADPVTWELRFGYYCDTWTEIEMPLDLYLSDDEAAQIAYVASVVGAE